MVNPAQPSTNPTEGQTGNHRTPAISIGDEAPPTTAQAIVLFDGACSLCSREIAHYRRREGASGITWVDLSEFQSGQPVHGIAYDDAMALFHVRDEHGNWHRGAAAFVELWRHLGAYRVVGNVIHRLRLTPLLDAAYRLFARWRLRRSCDSATCSPSAHRRENTQPVSATAGKTGTTGETLCE